MTLRGCDGFRRGAFLGRRKCSPCLRPSVQFSPGCVHFPTRCVQFPARCVHFSHQFSPNVSTRTGHVSTQNLDGDSRRPGLPGRSGSDFGGCAALGTRRASARGLGRLPRLPSSPFRDPCVTLGRLPGRPLTPGSSPPDRVRGRLGQAPTRSHRERGQEPPQLRGRGALCNGLPGEGKEALPQEHTREKDDGSLRGMESDQSDPPPAVGSWVTASRMMPGACNGFRREASLGPPKCSPRFWPGVQFSPRCVHFRAKCVHFFPPTAPNVFTRPAHVFTRSLDGECKPPRCSMTGAGVGPGVTGGHPEGRRGLRRGPGGRTGG